MIYRADNSPATSEEKVYDAAHDVCLEICEERVRQDAKFGTGRDFPDAPMDARSRMEARRTERMLRDACEQSFRNGSGTWIHILAEEVGEVGEATIDPVRLRAELVQVAAVAVAWIEALNRRPKIETTTFSSSPVQITSFEQISGEPIDPDSCPYDAD